MFKKTLLIGVVLISTLLLGGCLVTTPGASVEYKGPDLHNLFESKRQGVLVVNNMRDKQFHVYHRDKKLTRKPVRTGEDHFVRARWMPEGQRDSISLTLAVYDRSGARVGTATNTFNLRNSRRRDRSFDQWVVENYRSLR